MVYQQNKKPERGLYIAVDFTVHVSCAYFRPRVKSISHYGARYE